MRVVAILFALMLVMGLSFAGNSFIGTQSVIAQDDQGEMPGGEMTDKAPEGAGDEMKASDDVTEEGEMPGGEMTDKAAEGGDAGMGTTDESAEGELPGGDIPDDATK